MITLALVFTACMSGHCQRVQIPWEGTLMTCMLFGQQLAAQWTNEHPGWALDRGYRCESGRSA